MNLFQLVKNGTDVLGTDPCRFYEFGNAPESEQSYATWQILAGEPVNYLSGQPSQDMVEAQIDVWASSPAEVRKAARGVRRALDPSIQITHYVTGWDEESWMYRVTIRCNYLTEI